MNSPRHNTSRPPGTTGSTTTTPETEAERTVQGTASGSSASGSKVEDTAKAMRETVESQAEEQKGAISEMVADCAHALDAAAGELAKRNQHQAADYVNAIRSTMGNVKRTIDTKRPGDMVDDVTAFAREHPAAFLGGGLLVGMALGRLGKASADRERERARERAQEQSHTRAGPTTTATPSTATQNPATLHSSSPTHREDLP